jgi:hypothetical protein
MEPTERRPSTPPDVEAARSRLERVLATPLPGTLQERLDLLERHLRESLPASIDAPAPLRREDLPQTIGLIREVVADTHRRTNESATESFSECDHAVLEGAAAITVGVVIHPLVGLAAFGWGVYHLTRHCHEGD